MINISIEKQIEKTKDAYYDMLGQSGIGWHEEANDPTPFIKYMLQMVLACYVEFEERVGMMSEKGTSSTVYDILSEKVFTQTKDCLYQPLHLRT